MAIAWPPRAGSVPRLKPRRSGARPQPCARAVLRERGGRWPRRAGMATRETGGHVGAAIAQMIPFALGKMIAVNPTIAVILLLVSAHGRGKALAYLTGAALGPLVAGTL